MKIFLLFVLSTCLTLNCLAQQYVIKGNITGFPDRTKFLLKNLDTDAVIDSALIIHNKFTMKGSFANSPQSLWLYSPYDNKFYYVVLLIGNDTISVKGDIKDFPFDLSITGSKIQDELNILNTLTKEGFKQRNQLVAEFFSLKGDSSKIRGVAIWNSINVLDSTNHVLTKDFIHDHSNTYPALQYMYFLRNIFGRDSLRVMYSTLALPLLESLFGQRISNYLKVGDPLKKGDSMADFEAFDKVGKIHRPSEYKGRYILLDFSTTYCGPCIESLVDMKKLAATYADKLAIVSLSGDAGKKTWLTGIDRDKPNWLSLWDGKGIYSEAMLKYGVSGFPTFCLIDPQGKILSLWTGYGKNDDGTGSLEAAIMKVIGK